MENKVKYTHRYLARIIIEATTPLTMGTGEGNVMTDRLIATDVNGLPYIPGTALAGVLKHSLQEHLTDSTIDKLFGFQIKKDEEVKIRKEKKRPPTEEEKGQGSRLLLSHAQMLGFDGKVIDGIQSKITDTEFYRNFQNLPIRQHVRISHKGASEGGGKFDEQVVYKGTRFCFEMELVGTTDDSSVWEELLTQFSNPGFRMGGGTRKGFGEIIVSEYCEKVIDLTKDLKSYLDKSSDLGDDEFWKGIPLVKPEPSESEWLKYEITLTPDDFFLFGSGFGADNADMSYVTEKVIVGWDERNVRFSEGKVLIPASSVKGALAHRVAFHYNKTKKVFADTLTEDLLKKEGYKMDIDCKPEQNRLIEIATKGNPAVRALFGYSASNNDGQRGNTIFSDVYLKEPANEKLLNHVAIDRFTGGAMDGALFSEEVVGSKEEFKLTCFVNKDVKPEYLDAFDSTLKDLCVGMLPLGGGTMRGHGCFKGKITKNGKELKDENS